MEVHANVHPFVNTGSLSIPLKSAHDSGKTPDAALPSSRHGQDTVTLSQKGEEQSASDSGLSTGGVESVEKNHPLQLDRQELQQLQKLKKRDTEVRTHEQAHLSAAGQYARGGPSYSLTKGPDGRSYAVGGEVGIDVGKESTPEATLVKMQAIKRAALAPINPSSADRRIAAQASAKEAQARKEIMLKMQEVLVTAAAEKPVDGSSPPSSADSAERTDPSSSYAALKSVIAAYRNIAES